MSEEPAAGTQELLDRAARAVSGAVSATGAATIFAMDAQEGPDADSRRQSAQRAEGAARQGNEKAQTALRLLRALGAAAPGGPVARDTLPLDLLDTPGTRRLLSALEEATRAGEAVDRERGWVGADGEPTGYGETLAGMALQLRVEVMGPAGRE